MNTPQRIPAEPIRLSPEQTACSHAILERRGVNSLFFCKDCGAELVMPIEEEFSDLNAAWEQEPEMESEMERARR